MSHSKKDLNKANMPVSLAPSVKTREARDRDQDDTQQTNNYTPGFQSARIIKSEDSTQETDVHQANTTSESMGQGLVGSEKGPFKDIKKDDIKKSEDESSCDSDYQFEEEDLKKSQGELKKYLEGMPQVAADQGAKEKGEPYNIEESMVKGYNVERLKLAWDLHNTKLLPTLVKSDPVQKRIKIHGVAVCVEWQKNSIRRYKEDNVLKNGKRMKAHYGYFPNTTSPDGEELDCYVGDSLKSRRVFLLMQKPTPWDISQGDFDFEEKYMLGFDTLSDAHQAYIGSMPEEFFESIREISWGAFEERLIEAKQELRGGTDLKKSLGFSGLEKIPTKQAVSLVFKI